MSDIKILVGETHEVKFKVDIEGTITPVNEIRFTISVGPFKISFLGEYNFGVVKFKLQELERFMSPGTYEYFLEVYIVNQCFLPFKGTIELVKPVGVKASQVEDLIVEGVKIKSSLIEKSVSVEKVPEIEEKEVPEIEKKLIPEEKEVIKSVKSKKEKIAYVVMVEKEGRERQ
jgi:hypothetical protein